MRCLASAIVAVALLIPSFGMKRLAAAKPPADFPVSVTLRDIGCCGTPPACIAANSGADRILSDGKGAYVNGINGSQISARIINDPCCEYMNLSVDLYQRSSRTFQFLYSPASEFSSQYPNAPSGYLNAGGRMVVNKLGTVAWGQPTTILQAHFTTDVGMFRFDSVSDLPYYESQRFQVTRVNRTTWDVSTNYYSNGTLTAGDLAVLTSGATPLGLYHMPFGATVTCLSSSSCPP